MEFKQNLGNSLTRRVSVQQRFGKSGGLVLRRTGKWYIWSSVLRRKFSG